MKNNWFYLAILLTLTAAEVWPFDLGGPCAEQTDWSLENLNLQDDVKNKKDWPRAIELEKGSVRNMCGNAYRWFSLADTLLMAKREKEAIEVLDEMDRRGFEVKPSKADSYPAIQRFLESAQFRKSPVGERIEGKRKAVRQRRKEFLERLSKLEPKEQPPSPYIAKDACPFECCTYRQWEVLKDTVLMDRPEGKKIVGKAQKGSKVAAVTGEVHLVPLPINIVHDHPPFSKKDLVFMLDSLGEGHYNYWKDGKSDSGEIFVQEYCLKPSADCWAEHYLPESKQQKILWWVLIRLPNGVAGWSALPENFGNKDACG